MISCTFENGHKASLRYVVVDAIVLPAHSGLSSSESKTGRQVVKDKKILLIKRAPHLSNGGKWAIPGGFLDRDETCERAVVRELKEETGLSGKVLKLFKIIDAARKNEDRQNVAFDHFGIIQDFLKSSSTKFNEFVAYPFVL